MKQALIFSPYIDTFGGGEVYTLNFAQCLSRHDFDITLATNSTSTLNNARQYLNIDLQARIDSQLHCLLTSPTNLITKYQQLKNFDLCFFLSDGSLPFLFSATNILHFQVPFTSLKPSFITKLKLKNIHHLVCNSRFTKTIIDRQLNTNSQVIYPPTNLLSGKIVVKKNIILSVGRFTQTLHNKRQDILIHAFKQLVDTHKLTNWQLVFIGSLQENESQSFLNQLKKQAHHYPIKFLTNVSHTTLQKYYRQAKIFWLATGFDIDAAKQPELVEHFGLSTVEAMSAGAVPVVINKGGQKEIVTPAKDGFLFSSTDELIDKTQQLIQSPQVLHQLSSQAIKTSAKYSYQRFCQQVSQLLP